MVRVAPHVAATVRRFAHGVDRGSHSGAYGAPEVAVMIRPWMIYAVMLAALCSLCAYAGYTVCDTQWTQRDTDRKLADAEASAKLSEEYRVKEQKLNEHIGTIETKAINDAAAAEMAYRDVIDRLRNVGRNPTDGLRVKPALACRAMPNNTATASNGDEEVQSGLSAEVAERVIGIGAECNQVVASLDACQAYVESLRNKKPLD